MTLKTKAKFTTMLELLADEEMWDQFSNYVDEAVQSKIKIKQEQLIVKMLRDKCSEGFGIDPRLFNLAVDTRFSDDNKSRLESIEQQRTLLEFVMSEAE